MIILQRFQELKHLREAVREYVAFSKKVNTPAKRTIFVLLLLCAGRRFQALFCLIAAVNLLDDRVDGMRPLPSGHTLPSYLDEIEAFMDRFTGSDAQNFPRLAELRLLSHSADFFAKHGFKGIREQLRAIWRDYMPDARRTAAKEPFPTEHVLAQTQAANAGFIALCLRCIGAQGEAVDILSLDMGAEFIRSDTLCDLESDLQRGTVLVLRSEWEAAGVKPEAVLSSRTWSEIFAVPGLLRWYDDELQSLQNKWADQEPRVHAQLRGLLPSSLHFRATQFFILGKHTQNLREAAGTVSAFNASISIHPVAT